MIGGGRPLVPKIFSQSDRVGAKSSIFAIFSLVAPQPQSCIKYSTNKYQYHYQYQWSKYQYKYQYLTFEYQYQYQYITFKYQYQYKYCA